MNSFGVIGAQRQVQGKKFLVCLHAKGVKAVRFRHKPQKCYVVGQYLEGIGYEDKRVGVINTRAFNKHVTAT